MVRLRTLDFAAADWLVDVKMRVYGRPLTPHARRHPTHPISDIKMRVYGMRDENFFVIFSFFLYNIM